MRPGASAAPSTGCGRAAPAIAARSAIRGRLPAILLAAVSTCLAAQAVALAGSAKWSLTVEGGSEYDTNVHRADTVEGDAKVEAAPLARAGARLAVGWQRHADRLRLQAFGGARIFATDAAQTENAAVISADAAYEHDLGKRGVAAGVAAHVYDANGFQLAQPPADTPVGRNFTFAGGEATLAMAGPGHHHIGASAGYRHFTYKPDHTYDWNGPTFSLGYHTSIWRGDPDRDPDAAVFDIAVNYRLEKRSYAGVAYASACPQGAMPSPSCFVPTGYARSDLHHTLSAEVVYTGDLILSAGYALEVNDSNSYGQSLVRQRLQAGVTTDIGRGFYVTARGTLLLNLFVDPLLLARDINTQTFVSLDEENRNALEIHVGRDLGAHWAVEARYGFYTNEFATRELGFRRQVFYVGALYRYGDHRRPGG